MRWLGSVVVGGVLKAWVASFWSTRMEKLASRSLVRTCVKGGESIRSEVSSRRRRRGLVVDVSGVAGCWEEADMPDSRRTKSSWSWGGRR